MFGTYLRRELTGRRKQTIIIAIGMALAIALVIVVNSVAAGVKNAQAEVLKSVYGVGTDITITKPATAPGAGGSNAQCRRAVSPGRSTTRFTRGMSSTCQSDFTESTLRS